MEETDGFVEELEGVLPGRVTKNVSAFLRDWWPLLWITDEVQGKASAAVRPINASEVSKLLDFASAKGIPVYVHGGGSSVTGASIPSSGIVVDMSGMSQVLDIDEANRTVTVQAGARLKELEAKLNDKGFTLSQFPQSMDLVTVGGFISTMGTGQYSTRYGSAEDCVLRLEVVLPNGDVVWTRNRGAPRSSVGPDLARLFIGAEGSLGVVTAAELKIHKLPKIVWKAAYQFLEFEQAVEASKALLELDVRPAVCRVYNELESMFQFEEHSCVMILLYHFNSERATSAVREDVAAVLEENATPIDPALVDRWLEKRFNFRDDIDAIKRMGLTLETVELGVKWTRLYELYVDFVSTLVSMKGVSGVGAHVSHLYDQGACIYFTILHEPRREVYSSLWSVAAKTSKAHDATISHHHGVGILKKVYAKDEVPVKLLEAIKQAVDPTAVLSPDRFP